MAIDRELSEALKVWGVGVAPASSDFLLLLARRFPNWSALEHFAATLPVARVELKSASRKFGSLWPEQEISEALKIAPGNNRFLPVGTLMDGSVLCIDTSDRKWMRVGVFPFEKTVHLDDDRQFLKSNFRKFPFQYPEYLDYLASEPSDTSFL